MRVVGARESMMVDYMLYVQMRRTKMPVMHGITALKNSKKISIVVKLTFLTQCHTQEVTQKNMNFFKQHQLSNLSRNNFHIIVPQFLLHIFTLETLLMISLCMESYISQSSLQM